MDSRSGWYGFGTASGVAGQADSRETVFPTLDAGVVCCWSVSLATGLSFLSLYFALFGKCLFVPEKVLLHSLPPCYSLCVYSFPGVRVNAHGL